MFEQHDVSRRIISSCILFDDVLAATCSIDFVYLSGGLWGKPHDSWCAPLTPHCIFMFPSYEMTVVANKWLVTHLLFFVLRQAWNALRWFLMWNYDSLFGCHLVAYFHSTFLPYIADMFILMGSFVWRVEFEMDMPIGSMILPILHVVCFRRNNGHTMIATTHLFPSCRRSPWVNLCSWRRHFMVDLSCGVAWAILGGHEIAAQYQQPPHTYHKWREKLLGWENINSPFNPNTLHKTGVANLFDELPRMAHFIWMRAWSEISPVYHHSYH